METTKRALGVVHSTPISNTLKALAELPYSLARLNLELKVLCELRAYLQQARRAEWEKYVRVHEELNKKKVVRFNEPDYVRLSRDLDGEFSPRSPRDA